MVPAAQGRQVEPAGRVVRHGAGRAALGRRADAAARLDVRVAVELLAVGRERGRVLHVRARHVVAPVQVVDPVRAVARGVCTGADEDTTNMSLLDWLGCHHDGAGQNGKDEGEEVHLVACDSPAGPFFA